MTVIHRMLNTLALASMLACPLASAQQEMQDTPSGIAEAGKRIYRQGMLPSDRPVEADTRTGRLVAGQAAACANCHGRSGLGSSEGQTLVPSVAGPYLYRAKEAMVPQLAYLSRITEGKRAAYTDETLARAIREGVDANGRALGAPMPHYRLGDQDMAALLAYLKGLSAGPAPGVTANDVHFATVVTEGVTPSSRKALLDVLQTYARSKSASTRHESRRVTRGPWTMRDYRNYRNWRLHVWELKGDPDSWQAQMEEHYRRQPVFAVLGGLAAGPWQPLHEFCEREEIPCIFPSTDFPGGIGKSSFYTVYPFGGVVLEAQVLAAHLAGARSGPIMQVAAKGDGPAMAATAFRDEAAKRGLKLTQEHVLPPGEHFSATFWRNLPEQDRPAVLVIWDSAPRLEGLADFAKGMEQVFLSGALGGEKATIPRNLETKVRIVYPFDLPEKRAGNMARLRSWLLANRIAAPAQERVQGDAFLAATLTADALNKMPALDDGIVFSREFLMEQIESMTDSATTSSVYPHVNLAPGQRFASKGASIVKFSTTGGLSPASGWLVP